jgi:hypothetical protein
MADVITGNTELTATKQAVITAIVQKELQFSAKLLPYVTDYSVFAAPGARSVSIPKLTSFTVVDRASAAPGDASVLTSSVDTMNLDINAYVAWLVDSSDEIQSTINVQIEFARRAAAAHGRYVDTSIIAGWETHGDPTATAGNISRDIILEMRNSLQKNDGDLSMAAFVISPDQEEELLKVTEFSSAEVYGQPVIPNGVIGRVYGIPVVVHNGLATQQYFLAEKGGLAIAFQKAPAMSEQPANEYGTSAKRVAMDQLYGITGLQLGFKGVGPTESPLIIKDAN